MTSLREWNENPQLNESFATFKIFMRQQYLDLQAVGGLTFQNSAITLANKLK